MLATRVPSCVAKDERCRLVAITRVIALTKSVEFRQEKRVAIQARAHFFFFFRKALHGFITEDRRVNGVLALSRALGDTEQQPHVT
jgi:hypothetical protein